MLAHGATLFVRFRDAGSGADGGLPDATVVPSLSGLRYRKVTSDVEQSTSRMAGPVSIAGVAERLRSATVMPDHDSEGTMRYLCLVYHEAATIGALPTSEYDAIMGELLAYREELRRGGHYLASSPLEPVRPVATVRVRGGRVSVTDGPVAETHEHLGGFYLIEARDLNEAIRLASRMPPARLGSIEVRLMGEADPC